MAEIDFQKTEEEDNLGETVAHLFGFLVRRRWWIILPACCIILGSITVLWTLPNRYTSDATLVVVAQQVPQRYVLPNSTADLNSTLQAMKQEILSRTRLLRMVNDFGLYPKQRSGLAAEQLASLLLKDIVITPLAEHQQERTFDAFRVSFTSESGLLAQQVTSALTSLFINENLRTQEEQSTNTTKFLNDQVAEKKAKLEEQEQRLRDFKMRHIGELPEQQQGNLGILTGLQTQLQNITNSLNNAQQQQVYLQSLLEGQRRQTAFNRTGSSTSVPATSAVNRTLSPLETAQNDLARLESLRASLLLSRTSAHPDVIRVQREIAKVEELLKHLHATTTQLAEDRPTTTAPVAAAIPAEDDPSLAQLKGQLDVNRHAIESLSKEERRLKSIIAQYESRLNQTPVREQQQAGFLRETEALRLEYADLEKKKQESQLATNLAKQQGGLQFRLVDSASLPLVPSSPKRLKMSLLGTLAGIFIGLALAFVMEMRDTSFRSEKELAKHIGAPFVVEIPVIPTRNEERQLKLKSALEWVAGSAMVFIVLIAEYYIYKRG